MMTKPRMITTKELLRDMQACGFTGSFRMLLSIAQEDPDVYSARGTPTLYDIAQEVVKHMVLGNERQIIRSVVRRSQYAHYWLHVLRVFAFDNFYNRDENDYVIVAREPREAWRKLIGYLTHDLYSATPGVSFVPHVDIIRDYKPDRTRINVDMPLDNDN